nr:abortive infection system antitoxin AbiGi family protein [uncultured Carboxylicivirga sp.]
MTLSTNELFHFTKYEYLKSIMESKAFLPRYNLEFTYLSEKYQNKAALLPVAMVCFCDIPLELSKKHRERYGNHGIVLSESWKLRNGLNPVYYIQKESSLANVLADLVSSTESFIPIIQNNKKDINIPLTLGKVGHNLTYFSYFLKQFENKRETTVHYAGKIRTFEKRRFYDEREWRYIPFDALQNDELFLPIQYFDDETQLNIAHNRLEKYKLNFDYSDI